jgi:hypothetical protein
VAVICVAALTVKLIAAVVPQSTAVAPVKPAPVIVTVVPLSWFQRTGTVLAAPISLRILFVAVPLAQ